MKPRAALLSLLLLTGCVYYNGMYNARRLTRSAEKAERDGRSIDAGNYWGQVVVKADTLLARHPGSKWAVEAAALRGRALSRLNQCATAVPSLAEALPNLVDSAFAHAVQLDLANCRMQLGEYALAARSFERLSARGNPEQRARARLLRARALRLAGEGRAALALLDSLDDPRVSGERMAALALVGERAAFLALADSLLAAGDSTAPWDTTLAVVARTDPVTASEFVDRLRRLPRRGPEIQARWLLDDARRIAYVDAARAEERLVAVESISTGEDIAQRARLDRIRLAFRRAASPEDLEAYVPALDTLVATSSASIEAGILRALAERIRVATDSAPDAPDRGDMSLFVAAEVARDSLESPGIAAWLFRRVAARWPSSPYAPKALLAASRLVPGDVAELERLLGQQYADNPYVVAWNGIDTPALHALEDSLGAFQAAMGRVRPDSAAAAPPRRPPGQRPRPGAPTRARAEP